MSLIGAGRNHDFQLGIQSDSKDLGQRFVSKAAEIPVNTGNIICVAPGEHHTVIVMRDGSVLATGNDKSFGIGGKSRVIHKKFTEIKISDEKIIWAASGGNFTLYLTETKKAILCYKHHDEGMRTNPISIEAISVYASYMRGAILASDGKVYLLKHSNLDKVEGEFTFPSPVIDVACCITFCAVLLDDGSVFGNEKLNSGKKEFRRVESLQNYKIKKIAGYYESCLALDDKGAVFSYGDNSKGQLGVGTYENNFTSFRVISSLSGKVVKDIACSNHSLFLTEDGSLYGSGFSGYGQLFSTFHDGNNSTRFLFKDRRLKYIFAGIDYSLALCNVYIEKPSHPSQEINAVHNPEQESIKLESVLREIPKLKEEIRNEKEITMALTKENKELNKLITKTKKENEELNKSITKTKQEKEELNKLITKTKQENEELKQRLMSKMAIQFQQFRMFRIFLTSLLIHQSLMRSDQSAEVALVMFFWSKNTKQAPSLR